MNSKGAKTLIGVLLAAFCGAVIGLFVLVGLIFFVPTGASNANIDNRENRTINTAPANKPVQVNISASPTPEEEIEAVPTPEEENESPPSTPKTTFTPITLPTPAPKPNKTPAEVRQKPIGDKTPKTLSKPSPKKPVPTPSVHT